MTRRFPELLALHVIRDVWRHKLLAALSALSIALGVAVYVTVQIANYSANRSFSAAVDLVAGKARLEVRDAAGPLDETVFPRVASAPRVATATPIVEGRAALIGERGGFLQILGIDIFSNAPFSTFALRDAAQESVDADDQGESGRFDFEGWLAYPGRAALSVEAAQALDVGSGSTIEISTAGRPVELTVAGVADLDEAVARAGERLAVMDIGWAQELLGTQGELARILVLPDEDADLDEVARILQERLPPTALVERPARRSAQVERMLSGFQLNLQAMSHVSLLVGAFLIYNSVAASVVRRRSEIGTLRSLGASRLEIRLLYLGEALLYALPGAVLGLLLGVLGGNAVLALVGRTVSTLYLQTQIDSAWIPWDKLGVAALSAFAAAVAGAWLPAAEASRVNPVEALHPGHLREKTFRQTGAFALVAGVLFITGIAASWFAVATGPAWLGFAAAFCVLAGASCLVPALALGLGRVAAVVFAGRRDGAVPRLGAIAFMRSLHRTAVTVAALLCAVALGAGVSAMIHSFRATVSSWVQQVVVADVFVTAAANEGSGAPTVFLDKALLERLAADPDVRRTETYRRATVEVRGDPLALASVDRRDPTQLALVTPDAERVMETWRTPSHVLASESAARRLDLRPGSRITLPTPSGLVEFGVAGVYRDYTSDRGVLLMWRERFEELWKDDRVHSAAVYLHDGAKSDAFASAVRAKGSDVLVFSNTALRERIFEIFDQTFAITGVLRIVAVAVAVTGVFLALAVVVRERSRELAMLRAVGASRNQVRILVLSEAALIGIGAALGGVIAGVLLAMVLAWVINTAFFGWSIVLEVPWSTLAWTPVWVTAVAMAAALWPAALAGRIPVATALRDE